jgi:hypothetical protein
VLPHEFFALDLSDLDAMRFDFSLDMAANATRAGEVVESVPREEGKISAEVLTAAGIMKLLEG